MATEFYYNDAGTWRKAKEIYYNDAGTWRKAKELWYNDAGTWRKVFGSAELKLTGAVLLGLRSTDSQGLASLTFNNTGQLRHTWTNGVGTLTTSTNDPAGEWGLPLGLDASQFEIRFTHVSGSTAQVTYDTWQNLGSNRSILIQGATNSSSGARSTQFLVEIRAVGGTGPQVSANFTMSGQNQLIF